MVENVNIKSKAEAFKVGDIVNLNGRVAEVIEYINKKHIIIRFMPSGYTVKTSAKTIRTGNVKDLLSPSVYGVGIVGERIRSDDKERVGKRNLWSGILRRAHDPLFLKRNPSYMEVTVNKEMYYFPDFYDWCCSQKGSDQNNWHIDKDILFKGNKEYSFTKCCFVPFDINMLLTARKSERGNTPMGVSQEISGTYRAYVNECGKLLHLGVYPTMEDAFAVYKREKERIIRNQAIKWKSELDVRVYNALMNWQVEITD